jgi:hypothetical protein
MKKTMDQAMTGGCLCGAVRYRVNAPMTGVIACHCTHCRRVSGAGSSHNVPVATDALEVTAGAPKRYVDTAASGNRLFRFFCADCGSSLWSQREKMPGMVTLKAGTLDDASGLQLVMNIWTDSALPWMHVDPALERHPQNRPLKT